MKLISHAKVQNENREVNHVNQINPASYRGEGIQGGSHGVQAAGLTLCIVEPNHTPRLCNICRKWSYSW